jgi:transcriptional regulator with XRE-family HTH domain
MANVFISHSSKDKEFVRMLANDITEAGHKVWLDEREIKVGECIVTGIEKGLSENEYVIIVLSPNSVLSGLVEREWKSAYWSEIHKKKIIVLPVLYKKCEIPQLLKTKKYADFSEKYDVGLNELIESIHTFELNKKEEFSGLSSDKKYRKQTVTDISERFNHILKLMNQWYQDCSVGKLAEIMGLEKVSDLSKYFNGQEEPTFGFMEKFCDYFGVNVNWLKFGDGKPYRSTEYIVLFALNYYERICELQPKFIYFVKSKSKECETAIVLEIEEYKYIYFPKYYHISSYVGSTGREQIFSFYQLLKKLEHNGFYDKCSGCIVEHKLFVDLITGSVFPGVVCNRYGFNEPWWDDFTDVYHEYPIANEYERRHGKEFISAQRTVRGFLDRNKY